MMKITSLFLTFLATVTFTLHAQKNEYQSLSIPDSLRENANAVVRLNQIDIVISSQRSMTVKTKRVITVLNEKGINAIDATENYDKKTIVNSIEAVVYDELGIEIKKIKKKDFRDQSVIDGVTLLSDNRIIYLTYTPIQYPFTIVYESEIETSNTAFLPQWFPLDNYFLSVEKSQINVSYPTNLGFKKKEYNFSNFDIKKISDTPTQLSYEANNILAQKFEDYSAEFTLIYPKVMLGLELFHLEGVDGTARTWEEFGQWYSSKILSGTSDLSEETKSKMKALVGDEKDVIKKAKLIYNYVQKKSRYISIQVGIGGWRPMLASDTDRLGYGDCKALTNYTKALLDAVDVPSYNTILYGDRNKKSIDRDFVSMQGNHMILAIPSGENYIWLECTSQEDPFGYQGTFTDDRDVLVIKPEGGSIVRTKIYEDKGNVQVDKGVFTISGKGDFLGEIVINSEGSQYNQKAQIENLQPTEKEAHYKQYWSTINNIKLVKLSFNNDKDHIRFTEDLKISAVNYATVSQDKMIFIVNAFNQNTGNVKRIRNRKKSFEIQRGYLDTDEIEINLPVGFSTEFIPLNFMLKGKYGEYSTEIIKKSPNLLLYKRTMFLSKGEYSNKEYDEYRLFMEQISKNDNAKVILTKI